MFLFMDMSSNIWTKLLIIVSVIYHRRQAGYWAGPLSQHCVRGVSDVDLTVPALTASYIWKEKTQHTVQQNQSVTNYWKTKKENCMETEVAYWGFISIKIFWQMVKKLGKMWQRLTLERNQERSSSVQQSRDGAWLPDFQCATHSRTESVFLSPSQSVTHAERTLTPSDELLFKMPAVVQEGEELLLCSVSMSKVDIMKPSRSRRHSSWCMGSYIGNQGDTLEQTGVCATNECMNEWQTL